MRRRPGRASSGRGTGAAALAQRCAAAARDRDTSGDSTRRACGWPEQPTRGPTCLLLQVRPRAGPRLMSLRASRGTDPDRCSWRSHLGECGSGRSRPRARARLLSCADVVLDEGPSGNTHANPERGDARPRHTGLHRPAGHHATRPPTSTHRHRNARTKRVGSRRRANSRRPHGAFSYAYQSSPLTLHRTFKFRAVIPATALWHNALSRTRSAVVR